MKKSLLLIAALVLATFAINAQEKKAYETTANFDKKISGNCVSIEVMANFKDSRKLMQDLLRNGYQLKGKNSGKTMRYESVVFPEVSGNYMNLLISFEEKSKSKENPITKINVFMQKGPDAPFVTSATEPESVQKLKTFLDTKYYEVVYKHNLQLRIEQKNREIKEIEKEIDNLSREIDKRGKDIDGYKNDIKKANDNITKANSDIENAKKKLAEAKSKLSQQNNELKSIK